MVFKKPIENVEKSAKTKKNTYKKKNSCILVYSVNIDILRHCGRSEGMYDLKRSYLNDFEQCDILT